ncbi:hypothetical protein GCM10008937_09690 [Deinococcus depolymerans]|uniref:Secreted protein n=1 Tax=Deinococcus depolymerans TaxID=392408 RepID=A0ABN1BRL5_9DEIO
MGRGARGARAGVVAAARLAAGPGGLISPVASATSGGAFLSFSAAQLSESQPLGPSGLCRPFNRSPYDTDSVCFVDNPERHRVVNSTSGTRFSPTRIRSD